MRGAPQLGFSTTMRKINSRMFLLICVLPKDFRCPPTRASVNFIYFLNWSEILVFNGQCKEVDVRCYGMLAVVPSLKITLGRIERKSAEGLEATIDGELQHVGVVLDLIGKLRANRDVSEKRADFIAPRACLFDADMDVAIGVVEEFADGLGRNAVVDVDLTNDSLIACIGNFYGCLKAIECVVRTPTGGLTVAGIYLAEFGAAVRRVWRSDTVYAGVLHYHRSITALCEKVREVLIAILER